MASPKTNTYNFPHVPPPPPPAARPPSHKIPPPPPPHPFTPPPPHVLPPPSPPDNHPTVIIIVVISFGCLFFLAFILVALCCFIKKRKKKTVQETDIRNVDEHLRVKEVIVPGPHGAEAVILSVEDDVHIQEEIRKNEKFGEAGLHAKTAHGITNELEVAGASSSGSAHRHHLKHKA